MALKVKGQATRPVGAPKAGPKKRQAMSDQEALRRAVEEHTKKPSRATRKSGRVRTYAYKETPAAVVVSNGNLHGMRTPHSRGELVDAIGSVAATQAHEALLAFQSECDHLEVVWTMFDVSLGDAVPTHGTCTRCHRVLRYAKSHRGVLRLEWLERRLPKWQHGDWMELFTKDKTLWPYIIEEASEEVQHGTEG